MLSVNDPSECCRSYNSAHPGLLTQALTGDKQQLGRLLESHRKYLNVLADSRLDRKLRSRLSYTDIVQETMLQAHRDFANFRGKTEREFLGWLRQILAHTLARIVETHVLTKKRDVRRDVSMASMAQGIERSSMQLQAVFAAKVRSPSSHARERERAVILAEVMDSLPPAHREVLILRNMQGLRFTEIAQLMGRSTPAIKMLWMRAIKRLQQEYESRDEG